MNPGLSSSTSRTNSGHLLAVFACLFTTALIIAKVVSEKYLLFMGSPVSCSSIIYPFTFLVIHMATELYGPQQGGGTLITHGLSISIIVNLLLWIAIELPTATNSPIATANFESMLGSSLSMTISSLGAYLVGQFLNLYLFTGSQSLLSKRPLWLRSMSASLGAQLVDTILFATALYTFGATLEGSTSFFNNMVKEYILKALVTFFSVPFIYISIPLGRKQLGYRTAK